MQSRSKKGAPKVKQATKKRRKKKRLEDLPLPQEQHLEHLAKTLAKQIDHERFTQKYAKIADVLALVGMGAFLAASVAVPNLPKALKLFYNPGADKAWKRFNVPYLKRTLKRLEKQKLVEIETAEDVQIVKITSAGRRRILKYALDTLEIQKPDAWDRKWRLISYDIPNNQHRLRNVLRDYLKAWGFYPLHESVFLHAYPCEKEVEFLREYLKIGEFVRIFIVTKIENDKPFKDFFGV